MNFVVRALMILALLVAAVVGATFVYKRSAPDRDAASTHQATDSTGEAAEAPELTEEFSAGLLALKEERDDDALTIFESIPSSSPDYTRALQQLGVLYARQDELEKALDTMLLLTANLPDDPDTHALMGWVLYLAGHYREAEISALRVLELDPTHVATRYNIGLYRTAQNRTQEAVTAYIRAMKLDPEGTQVTRHRERLAVYHDQNEQLPAPHYLLAFFANSMADRENEIVELEHFLGLVPGGAEAENARVQLEKARQATED